MKWFVVPESQGRDPASTTRRQNAYRAALARGAEPGRFCETREEAERLAAEVEKITRHRWVVQEVNL